MLLRTFFLFATVFLLNACASPRINTTEQRIKTQIVAAGIIKDKFYLSTPERDFEFDIHHEKERDVFSIFQTFKHAVQTELPKIASDDIEIEQTERNWISINSETNHIKGTNTLKTSINIEAEITIKPTNDGADNNELEQKMKRLAAVSANFVQQMEKLAIVGAIYGNWGTPNNVMYRDMSNRDYVAVFRYKNNSGREIKLDNREQFLKQNALRYPINISVTNSHQTISPATFGDHIKSAASEAPSIIFLPVVLIGTIPLLLMTPKSDGAIGN